ncbi:MAG: hypothetical protein CVU44_17455 [Chloroflexi bacterium HGW-Chloroflexi-6]|nr:MAG: hypothetical protein CVU44_17455 [Chloroflexi bacterium HGW-Chloroflexi-6]
MKSRSLIVLLAALLVVSASLSCSLFPFGGTPTPEPDPCCAVTPGGLLKFEPESLPAAQLGDAYQAEIRITQNITPAYDIFISDGSLSAGLELVEVQGEDSAIISGTPQESGTFRFTVTAYCYGTMVSGQAGDMEYSIVVEEE